MAGLTVTLEFDFSGFKKGLRGRVDSAQRVLTTECKNAADDFTPMDTGALKNNFAYTVNERGVINGWTYNERYAQRQWYGVTKDKTKT